MAYIKFQGIPLSLVQDSEDLFIFPILDELNNPIDVSAGWKALLIVSSSAQPDRAGELGRFLTAEFTFADGEVRLAPTAERSIEFHTGLFLYSLFLSNDDFVADRHLVAAGSFQVVPSAFS